jgi:16S rRNA (adenine(1408)-N(1))-methyltransferase
METIRGKKSFNIDFNEFTLRHKNYNRLILDLGTGDGKFAFHYAQAFPNHFVIGLDSCRENLHEYSRANLSNLIYDIANAQHLPCELYGVISHIHINFPWGSLLQSLLRGDVNLFCGLEKISTPHALIHLNLNAGALNEQGWSLPNGVEQVEVNLKRAGWQMNGQKEMNIQTLKKFPSAWSKRIAVGRDPRAISLSGCK